MVQKKKLARDSNLEESKMIPVEFNEVKQKLEFEEDMNPLDMLAKEIEEDIQYNNTENKVAPTNVSSIFSSISSNILFFS